MQMSRPPLHTVEALTKVLDSYCGNPYLTVAAARANVSYPSLMRYRDLSANGNETYILEWNGVTAQFASHLARARTMYMEQVEAAALDRAHRGTREKVFYQGRPSWVMDPRYEGWTAEMLADNLLDNEDRYMHDKVTHARIQHEIEHPAPVELQKAALQAYSKRWASQAHVDINSVVSLGVTMVGNAKPKLVDVTPKPAQIEHVGKPTEVSGVFDEVAPSASAADAHPAPPDAAAASSPAPVEDEIPQPKSFNDFERVIAPETVANRTSGLPTQDKIDRSPTNPVRIALLAEMENRNRRIEQERAAGKLPPVAPIASPEMRPDPDRDLDDVTGERVKAPPPPTMDSAAEQIHAIKKKIRDGVPLGPIERQVKNALDRGSIADARTLLGIRPAERDGIGAGTVPAGGAAVVTSASTRGNPMKMV